MTANGMQGDPRVTSEFFQMALIDRTTAWIREKPVTATAAAGLFGAVLGGLVLSGWGRLAFVAVAGYFVNELWHREGRVDLEHLANAVGTSAEPSAR
jgi:hypothetical protein